MNNIEHDRDIKLNKYIAYIVGAIHMKTDEFMLDVLDPNKPYEQKIYKWIIFCFKRNKTKDEALQIIQKARRCLSVRNELINNVEYTSHNRLQEISIMLNSNSDYNKLNEEEKLIVQEKIEELIDNISPQNIIAKALESVNPIVTVEKEKNKISISRGTIDRIKKFVRRINLKNYWNQRKNEE